MASIDVKETPVPIREDRPIAIEGATSIMNVDISTTELVPRPIIEIVFDKPFLKAVLHGPKGPNDFYGSDMLNASGNLIRFLFDSPKFDANHVVTFTVYSVGPVHVNDASVSSR